MARTKQSDSWGPPEQVAEPVDPPVHLSERSKELWRQFVPSPIDTAGKQEMLTTALECRDRVEQCRQVISMEGMMVGKDDGKMSHAHPLLKVEKDAQALFTKVLRELGLHWKGQNR